MELPKDLKDEIWEYCRLNDITDLNAFMVRMLKQGYTTEKYGPTPFKMGGEPEKIVEKEVIIEKVVEVPTEIIKEVEVVKEVPIEKIVIQEVIKEIPVEKIVQVSDDKQINELLLKINKLENKPAEIVEIEVIKEVPIEVIKEVEKIVEVNVNDDKKIKELEQEVENLKIELELEKNRHYQPPKKEKPKDDKPKSMLGNVISWVSKTERGDLYNE